MFFCNLSILELYVNIVVPEMYQLWFKRHRAKIHNSFLNSVHSAYNLVFLTNTLLSKSCYSHIREFCCIRHFTWSQYCLPTEDITVCQLIFIAVGRLYYF